MNVALETFGFPQITKRTRNPVYARFQQHKRDMRSLFDSVFASPETRDLSAVVLSCHSLRLFIHKVCQELSALHAKNVVHRGISLETVSVSNLENGHFTDKSNVILANPKSLKPYMLKLSQLVFTAPETLLSTRLEVDDRADSWSVGVLLFRLATGQLPFTLTNLASDEAILQQYSQQPEFWRIMDPTLRSMCNQLIVVNRGNRVRVHDLMQLAAVSTLQPHEAQHNTVNVALIVQATQQHVGLLRNSLAAVIYRSRQILRSQSKPQNFGVQISCYGTSADGRLQTSGLQKDSKDLVDFLQHANANEAEHPGLWAEEGAIKHTIQESQNIASAIVFGANEPQPSPEAARLAEQLNTHATELHFISTELMPVSNCEFLDTDAEYAGELLTGMLARRILSTLGGNRSVRAYERMYPTPSAYDQFYKVVDDLGEGSFGVVHKVVGIADQQTYDVRCGDVFARKEMKDGVEEEKMMKHEIEIHSQLHHSNIVRYKHSYARQGKARLVLELAEGGDLWNHVLQTGYLQEEQLIPIALQMAAGMLHLHANNLAHCDLKPDNVFLGRHNAQLVAKLGDFGYTVCCVGGKLLGIADGCFAYRAPETLLGREQTIAVDVWAFACVIIVIATGFHAFVRDDDNFFWDFYRIFCRIRDNPIPVNNLDETFSEELRTLVNRMLNPNPTTRPTIEEVIAKLEAIQKELEKDAQPAGEK